MSEANDNGLVVKEDRRKEWRERLEQALNSVLEAVGQACEGNAVEHLKENGSWDTGRLAGSITHVVEPNEKSVYVGTNVEYAPYVELGTGKYYPGGRDTPWAWEDNEGNIHFTHGNRAKPYLKPAAENHRDEYADIIKGILKG